MSEDLASRAKAKQILWLRDVSWALVSFGHHALVSGKAWRMFLAANRNGCDNHAILPLFRND